MPSLKTVHCGLRRISFSRETLSIPPLIPIKTIFKQFLGQSWITVGSARTERLQFSAGFAIAD